MKRLIVLILMVVLLTPQVVTAQSIEPVELDPATFGEGWEARDAIEGGRGIAGVWDWRYVYVGPAGATITIDVYRMGPAMSDVSAQWQAAAERWQTRTLFELVGPVEAIPASQSPFPWGTTDALRADDFDSATGEPAALGLYAVPEQNVALMVRVHGTAANRSGITALNWIVNEWIQAQ